MIMCCRSRYSRLCSLIVSSLHPYTLSFSQEPELVSLTKDKERDLLIILSQVSREIQRWTNELECDSNNEIAKSPAFDNECFGGLETRSGSHNCLVTIVSVLVVFLTVECQHIQHLASNIIVVISSFVAKTGSKWDEFLHFLSICLEVSISNISSTLVYLRTGTPNLDYNSASLISNLKPKLVTANWSTVAGLTRVLRNILKCSNQEYDGEFAEIYMHSIKCFLSNVPWDLLNEILVGEVHRDALVLKSIVSPEAGFVFLGSLLQLLCSLVKQCGFLEVPGGSLDEHPIHVKITSLVPKLLRWCFYKQGEYDRTPISQYLRHKMLKLMIRLSSQVHSELSTSELWLQLLHTYFQDVLLQPISGYHAGFCDCLEGSPFRSSITHGEVHRTSNHHLQRQCVFLFLKCSFSLLVHSKKTDEKCACATSDPCFTELQFGQECCTRMKGLSELSEWLQNHLPLELFEGFEMYVEKCSLFTLSFLQLYMEEDDFLFDVLLHLLSLSLSAGQVDWNERDTAFQGRKGDILFHILTIFNPVKLFHLFLAELKYDHLLLLDYLISKDTGISCVQYLLRCLRIVCTSWPSFFEISICWDETSLSACKKRKVLLDGSESYGKVERSAATRKGYGCPRSLEKECKGNKKSGSNHFNTRRLHFENAKGCLLSLKKSLENLHQKSLFPYNPTALLKSFARFQELCHKQEKDNV